MSIIPPEERLLGSLCQKVDKTNDQLFRIADQLERIYGLLAQREANEGTNPFRS